MELSSPQSKNHHKLIKTEHIISSEKNSEHEWIFNEQMHTPKHLSLYSIETNTQYVKWIKNGRDIYAYPKIYAYYVHHHQPWKSFLFHLPYLLIIFSSISLFFISSVFPSCTLAILCRLFFAVASRSASSPSYSLTQQLCTTQLRIKTPNCITNIAIRIPHSNLTSTFASLGSLGDFSISRLDFSLVNSARIPSNCPADEARRRETCVMKQNWVRWE